MEKREKFVPFTSEEMVARQLNDERMNILGLLTKCEIQAMGFAEEITKTSALEKSEENDKKLEELKDELEKTQNRIIAFKETYKNICALEKDAKKIYQ